MSPITERDAARLRTRAVNVDNAVSELEAIAFRAADSAHRLRSTRENVFALMAAGGLLHGFYSTFEGLLRDTADGLDGSLPSGTDWQARLLQQMSRSVPGLRPALFNNAMCAKLDELRAFGHLFRNPHEFNLRAEPIGELLDELPTLWTVLEPDLRAFAAQLRAMADALDS